MALSGVKLDSDGASFVSNCFPVRGLFKRNLNEGLSRVFIFLQVNLRLKQNGFIFVS
jgi:hypothetical protein